MADVKACAIVLELICGDHFTTHYSTGRFVHAIFLNLIRQIDPDAAERLHNKNERKPFTTSIIWANKYHLQPGDTAFIRFAILDPTLVEPLTARFVLNCPKSLTICGKEFLVKKVHASQDSHPMAGVFVNGSHEPISQVRINFITPTAFSRREGKNQLYDLNMSPKNIFGYVRRIWETCSDTRVDLSFDDWCERHILIRQLTLRPPCKVDFEKFSMKGVTGSGVYQLEADHHNQRYASFWATLVRFLPYSSLGYKTTFGMGRVSTEILQEVD